MNDGKDWYAWHNPYIDHDTGPAYPTAYGIYYDTLQAGSEIYVKGDDPATTEADARKWASGLVERAKKRLKELDAG
jgi:hypothetical protein